MFRIVLLDLFLMKKLLKSQIYIVTVYKTVKFVLLKTHAAEEEKKKNKKNTNAKRNKHWIQTHTICQVT